MSANKQHMGWIFWCCYGLLAMMAHGQDGPFCAYQVIESHPHDEAMFTQGLYWQDGLLYESSGGYGRSKLVVYRWPKTYVIAESRLPNKLFAEGVTVHDGRVYQLTWKTGELRVYDAKSLKYLKTKQFKGQGWGLTHTESDLIRSDGRRCLSWHDFRTFEKKKRQCVDQDLRLNALAYQDGVLFANDFPSDKLVRIDMATGKVLDTLNLAPLKSGSKALMANGVAVIGPRQIIVTGKQWDKLYVLDVSGCKASSTQKKATGLAP